jgi:hypothetical protein
MTYTVTLVGFSDAPRDVVHAAETRFRIALDKALGDRVVAVMTAFENARKSNPNELTLGEMSLGGEWQKAYELAKAAGLRGLGGSGEAYFKVLAG